MTWIASLFGGKRKRTLIKSGQAINPTAAARPTAHRSKTKSASAESVTEDRPIEERAFPTPLKGVGNLDRRIRGTLEQREIRILDAVGRRVEAGDYDLPNLPSTSALVLDMSANPSVDINDMSKAIEEDPVLSSELLKTANSVMYGGLMKADTLHQAVVRLGVRNLRGLIFALSMKSVISRSRGLLAYAEEVWRQSLSVAFISRRLAWVAKEEREKAFLMGLLHNIGKVALIDLMGNVVDNRTQITRSVIGRVFQKYHERTGADMARAWNLPEEVASVAGCHHDYMANEEHPRGAALVSLAQKMDLFLTLGARRDYFDLRTSEEVVFLAMERADVYRVFDTCLQEYFDRADQSQAALVC